MKKEVLKSKFAKTKTNNSTSGITLVALVITIIILLILAGISIATLGGENGLLTRANEAKKAQIEAEMKEKLQLAIQELQIQKQGEATLDDITQEWLNEKLKDYKTTIQDDPTTGGKKVTIKHNGITGIFIIDKDLNVIKKENNEGSLKFTYEVGQRDGEKVKITIKVQDEENGINKIEIPGKEEMTLNGTNEQIEIEYEVLLEQEYKITITLANGQKKEETILINEYYHKVTTNLPEGITIDNKKVKTEYNKPYQAKITAEQDYAIETLTVTMGGTPVTVDKTTGEINIDKVTGDIEIKATATKLEIEYTAIAISTSSSASNTASVGANTQNVGTPLYINIIAKLKGVACTVTLKEDSTKTVPYAITRNGKYVFIVTGTYNGKTIIKEKEVIVNKYKATGGFVQYDAGEWTKEEIDALKSKSLYNINTSKTASAEAGLNFTFGGFTYKEDTENSSNINNGTVITSRNQSVAPGSNYGTPNYDGWQILDSNEQDGKTYVTKLIHAGSPENFVFYHAGGDAPKQAEYILSNGARQKNYNTYQPRNWDLYKDKKQLKLIKEVYVVENATTEFANKTFIKFTGAAWWQAKADIYSRGLNWIEATNTYSDYRGAGCMGVRPIINLETGVYIASGDGSKETPYILAKED